MDRLNQAIRSQIRGLIHTLIVQSTHLQHNRRSLHPDRHGLAAARRAVGRHVRRSRYVGTQTSMLRSSSHRVYSNPSRSKHQEPMAHTA